MSRRLAPLLAALLVPLAGCNILGPLGYLLAPPQIEKAQVALTKERLAIVIDYARPEQENPVFTQAFRARLVERLKDKKASDNVVPAAELAKVQQANPDFPKWNLQRVGRELKADQVLYVRIDNLSMRPDPEHPLLEPSVTMHLKLIGVKEDKKNARLWPPANELEGREVSRGRPMQEAVDARGIDEETVKLAKDAAVLAAMPFHEVDKEEPVPWEP